MFKYVQRWTWLLMLPLVLTAGLAWSAEVHRKHGGLYIYLPPSADFNVVVDRLQSEIKAHTWDVTGVMNIDDGLRQHYGMNIQNKLIFACKSQYLAQGIKDDPNITLLVPCRFAVYRVDYAGRAAGQGADGGKIVIGVADPVREAESLGIQQREAAVLAGRELESMLRAVAEFFVKK